MEILARDKKGGGIKSMYNTLQHCNKVASQSQVLGVVGIGTGNILTRVLTVVLLSKSLLIMSPASSVMFYTKG